MKIAEIIINSQVRSLNRIYHYLADESMNLCAGMRVLVPFGGANKTCDGYCVGITDKTDYAGEMKKVKTVLDSQPIISDYGMKLAEYISKTCLINMAQALRLLLPPALNVKTERRVALVDGAQAVGLTATQKAAFNILSAAKKDIEINRLLSAAGIKSSSVITNLEKKGIVKTFERTVGKSKEKMRSFATVNVDEALFEDIISELKGSSKKAAVAFELLTEHTSLPVSELLEMANCSRSSVQLLEKKGYVVLGEKQIFRLPSELGDVKELHKTPTKEQKIAIDYISDSLNRSKTETILLHGITGSGKTEVFLQAAAECIKQGKNAIILVPEISLTPQMVDRVTSRFGKTVALLHSGLSMGERYDEWCRIKNGEARLVVGARSAIFAPFDNVGLIIVDEEHDDSYKSESAPCYSAVNVALFRGRQYGGVVVLASATPSVSTYYNAQQGKYKILKLTERFNKQNLPAVEIVDMTRELAAGNRGILSNRLCEEIEKNLQKKEQTILFLNRRGYSTFVTCRACGFVAKCPHCDVSLTYHSSTDTLVCHYCGYSCNNMHTCPECGSYYIKYFGTGTQRIEEDLKKRFPGISVLRMDADTTSGRHSHQEILNRFEKDRVDVLIGTQMVTKGIDYPSVTLVGVIAADVMLNMDDYRASERSFSMLTQVCGRAGRGDIPGRAIIQSYNPAAPALVLAKNQNYEKFYEGEIKLRHMLKNPPFVRIINVVVSGENEKDTENYSYIVNNLIKKHLEQNNVMCADYFEPMPAPLSKIKNRFRYRILLKVSGDKILDVLHGVLEDHEQNKTKISVTVGINPTSVL